MDVVLEVVDTLIGDRLYAHVLPALPQKGYATAITSGNNYSNPYSTLGYHYEPASQFFSFEPSELAYMSRWPRDNIYRQALSLFFITWLFGAVLYFALGTLSYLFIFDKETMKHPRYIKNQVSLEIRETVSSLHWIAVMTVPFFLAEVRGHSKMYDTSADGPGRWYDIIQFPFFIAFTDCFIYWIHRGLHHKSVYKHLHKRHHKWVVPTPFASHAFHPVDGFAQSLPYHVFPFLFPLQKFAYIALFVFVNVWTVSIHDGEYAMNSRIINGAACHTMHHLQFVCNYGQFTTVWDRLGGSYREPNEELFRRDEKLGKEAMERQTKRADEYIKDLEGEDERVYGTDEPMETKKLR